MSSFVPKGEYVHFDKQWRGVFILEPSDYTKRNWVLILITSTIRMAGLSQKHIHAGSGSREKTGIGKQVRQLG